MTKNKRAITRNPPSINKTIKNRFKSKSSFTWSFQLIDFDGIFGWQNCACHKKFQEILTKKRSFEGLSLAELAYQGSHLVALHNICKDAIKRLRNLNLDDIDELYSFRLNNKERIWCILHENIMKILWWDPDHQVCPSLKKGS